MDIPLYHKREGYAVGKVQFSDFGNDFQVRCTKLTLASLHRTDLDFSLAQAQSVTGRFLPIAARYGASHGLALSIGKGQISGVKQH